MIWTKYAFTCRRTSKKKKATVTEQDYTKHLDKVFKDANAEEQETYFETDAGLHCHGIFIAGSNFKDLKLRTRGWHLHFISIYDLEGWTKYILKSQESQTKSEPTPLIDDIPDDDFKMPTRPLWKPTQRDWYEFEKWMTDKNLKALSDLENEYYGIWDKD